MYFSILSYSSYLHLILNLIIYQNYSEVKCATKNVSERFSKKDASFHYVSHHLALAHFTFIVQFGGFVDIFIQLRYQCLNYIKFLVHFQLLVQSYFIYIL